jgi:hypothetical protein
MVFDTHLQNNQSKLVAQVVEGLFYKHKALSSDPSSTKSKKLGEKF